MTEYYRMAEKEIKHISGYQHRIFWNIEEITGKTNANGYIVQWVDANTTSKEICMEGRPYFEAWYVKDGLIGSEKYDDEFWADYLEEPGEVTYKTKVFWVDEKDDLFNFVNGWEPGTVHMANELPSAYEFDEIKDRGPICERYFHWNSRDYEKQNF